MGIVFKKKFTIEDCDFLLRIIICNQNTIDLNSAYINNYFMIILTLKFFDVWIFIFIICKNQSLSILLPQSKINVILEIYFYYLIENIFRLYAKTYLEVVGSVPTENIF